MSARMLAGLLALAFAGCAAAPPGDAAPTDDASPAPPLTERQAACATAGDGQEAWIAPAPPVRIYGNTYDVGTCGITALLVTSDEGDVLIDSGVPEAAMLVLGNIAQLGVDPAEVKWLLSSHEHYDHVGATAEIRRLTGARTAASALAKAQLETGEALPEDPQSGSIPSFEGFPIDRVMQDGEVLQLGPLAFTLHASPAHTPGSSSWTWQACEDGDCRTIAYADSISTPAADGYRFADHPDYVAQVRIGLRAVAALPCDILLTPHPGASGMDARLASGTLIDPKACADYAARGEAAFDRLLAGETGQ